MKGRTIRVMPKWEYCVVSVEIYREGSGRIHELLYITRPGKARASITNPLGALGLLNKLGGEGWELVDVEAGSFYLKRTPIQKHKKATRTHRA